MPFIITVNSKRTPVSTPCGCDEGRRDVDAAKKYHENTVCIDRYSVSKVLS